MGDEECKGEENKEKGGRELKREEKAEWKWNKERILLKRKEYPMNPPSMETSSSVKNRDLRFPRRNKIKAEEMDQMMRSKSYQVLY